MTTKTDYGYKMPLEDVWKFSAKFSEDGTYLKFNIP